ncbi:hypothetical protein [Zongyangia hominis]|uniref:Uncharacterized protein n=1 Tax=Zongyangia hominis TaxID=2763677 RepID=A0A926IAT4_9FIRM|nr:hypothetical protein [Zongyangia hominis]MBC8570541.1 hypothetical protein [Zongyangia hominis]
MNKDTIAIPTVKAGKAGGENQAGPETLEKINRYSLRPMEAGEVYVFSLILCDNDIDRDNERFDKEGLDALSQLFLGKTGIFDHNPKSQNQTARIFDCQVLPDESRKCADGTPYFYLKANAYAVRSKQNEGLILDIDAGIKKEVSIGCSVEGKICSICGEDVKKDRCTHQKGRRYDGKLCYHLLQRPTDAYEWSFVAVPAQRRAGVTKSYHITGGKTMEHLIKSLSMGEEVLLSSHEAGELSDYIGQLEKKAALGTQYVEDLKSHVRALSLLCGEDIPAPAFSTLVDKMDITELKAFEKSFEERLGQGPAPQLKAAPSKDRTPNGEFKI